MRSRGIPRNVHTFSALMNVCIKARRRPAGLDAPSMQLHADAYSCRQPAALFVEREYRRRECRIHLARDRRLSMGLP